MEMLLASCSCGCTISGKGPDGEVIITRTKKGKPLLEFQGHRYNCKHTLGLRTYWVCNKAPQGCKVTVVTFDDVIVKIRNDHNHL